MKVKIYIWRRKMEQKQKISKIMYRAELTWPDEGEDEWYRSYWLYTPLFPQEAQAKTAANKLVKMIEGGTK